MTGRWVSDLTEKKVGDSVKAEGRIAVDTFKKDEAHFFDVAVWGKPAEIALQYCKKGDLAIISGRLTQETWEKEGEKRSKVVIVAERVELPPRSASSGEAAAKPSPRADGKRTAPVDEVEDW
jgi:single-strand DNA-binding protein